MRLAESSIILGNVPVQSSTSIRGFPVSVVAVANNFTKRLMRLNWANLHPPSQGDCSLHGVGVPKKSVRTPGGVFCFRPHRRCGPCRAVFLVTFYSGVSLCLKLNNCVERTNLKRFCRNDRIQGEPTFRSTLPGLMPSWAKAVPSADLGGTIHLFTRDAAVAPPWFVDRCGPCRAVFW